MIYLVKTVIVKLGKRAVLVSIFKESMESINYKRMPDGWALKESWTVHDDKGK